MVNGMPVWLTLVPTGPHILYKRDATRERLLLLVKVEYLGGRLQDLSADHLVLSVDEKIGCARREQSLLFD